MTVLPAADGNPREIHRFMLCDAGLNVIYSGDGDLNDFLADVLVVVDTPEGNRHIACITSTEWVI